MVRKVQLPTTVHVTVFQVVLSQWNSSAYVESTPGIVGCGAGEPPGV